MLGRDCRDNGHVELMHDQSKLPPRRAEQHLEALLPMADDPDAGVRRELILAFRNLPTDKVGDALRKLAASWDGQDRWYLEALGLALEKRESTYLSQLFDGSLYGDLDLERAGRDRVLALPPYFPVDRNEAYIAAGTPDLPATALSKSLGLAWRLHCRESLPLLERISPHLRTPELQQAADDILDRMEDPAAAEVVASLVIRVDDPLRRNALFAMLARRLSGDMGRRAQPAADDPAHRRRDEQSRDAAARASRWPPRPATAATAAIFERFAQDARLPIETRVAAVEAIGSFDITPNRVPEQLVAAVRGKPSSDPVAEAAVRAMSRHSGALGRLADILTARDYPLGLRREALRGLAGSRTAGIACSSWPRRASCPRTSRGTRRPCCIPRRCGACATRRPRCCPLPEAGRRADAAADRRADPPRGRCREGAPGLLPHRRECLRELPPRPGARPVDRAGPLDDRGQVRPATS